MMHVYQAQNWIGRDISDLCKNTIFHVAAIINDTSGCGALEYHINHKQTIFVHTRIKHPSCSMRWWGMWWRAKEVNSNGDCHFDAVLHQHDSKIEVFVLPYITMIFIFNVFVLVYEEELFVSKNKLSNWKSRKRKSSMMATRNFALFPISWHLVFLHQDLARES